MSTGMFPRLQHQTPRAILAVLTEFLLFQHAEGFAGEYVKGQFLLHLAIFSLPN